MRCFITASAAVAFLVAMTLLCDRPTSAGQTQKKETAKLNGTIDCKEKADFAPDTIVTVELRDTSLQDVKAITIAKQMIKDLKKFPIKFEIEYDPSDIKPKNTYSLSVRITTKDKLDYINDTQIPVLTRSAPTKDVKAAVVPVKKT